MKQSDLARVRRAAQFALATSLAGSLAACQESQSISDMRAFHPIPPATLALMQKEGATEMSPVLIRTFKKEAEFEIWKMNREGKYVYIKTFPMCRWSGQLGPKSREGDRQVPEGFYSIGPGQMNPNSHYYLSFNVGYPNDYDKAHGDTGGEIMVHGICSSAGCFSMTNEQMDEIYAIAREAFAGGQRAIQLESFPFRMTAENLAKFRLDPNMPFWRQLKRGSDYFEVTHKEPTVDVCGRRYVFDKLPAAGGRLEPVAPCPALKDEDPSVTAAVDAKQRQDDLQVAALVDKGVVPVRLVYRDGGQNPTFANKFADVSDPAALAQAPMEIPISPTGAPAKSRPAAEKKPMALASAATAVTAPRSDRSGRVKVAQSRSKEEASSGPARPQLAAAPATEYAKPSAPLLGRWLSAVGDTLGQRHRVAQVARQSQ